MTVQTAEVLEQLSIDDTGRIRMTPGRPDPGTRQNPRRLLDALAAALVEGSEDAVIAKLVDGRVLSWNCGAERLFGFTATEMIGRPITLIFPADRLAEEQELIARILLGEHVSHYETVRLHKDGRPLPVSVTLSPIRDGAGNIFAISKSVSDISELVRLREAQRSSSRAEREQREFMDRAGRMALIGAWSFDPHTQESYWSQAVRDMHEVGVDFVPSVETALKFYPGESRKDIESAVRRCVEFQEPYDLELPLRTAKGADLWIRTAGEAEVQDGVVTRVFGVIQDITRQKRNEREIIAEHERLRVTLESIADSVITTDRWGYVNWLNSTAAELTAWPVREALGRHADDVFRIVDETTRAPAMSTVGRAIAENAVRTLAGRSVLIRRDGREVAVEDCVAPIHDADGAIVGTILVFRDVSQRRRADAALATSELRFRSIFEGVSESILIVEGDSHRVLEANPPARRLFAAGEDLIGRRLEEILGSDAPFTQDAARQQLAALKSEIPVQFEWRGRAAGRPFWTNNIARLTLLGEQQVIFMTSRDETDAKTLQEQLRQSQKMEAIGLLAGGIAHDFNNLLAVVTMNLEVARDHCSADSVIQETTADALRAAEAGAQMVRQLLATSRRQTLVPSTIDLGALLAGQVLVLRRTLSASISIHTSIAADLWPVIADPQQLESAILNLAVNARDAMPRGGSLTFEARNVTVPEGELSDTAPPRPAAGDFVSLKISDTGSGMKPEVLARVFEPFFTTKPPGKGTGLGLSMVYGFAKQSGGHVSVESELGKGTTVNLLLPRSSAAVTGLNPVHSSATDPAMPGRTILVVEDNESLRKVVVRALRARQYRAVEAADGAQAASILDSSDRIDLLLTDVVLPGGRSGPEIARQAARNRPALKVLFTSGYTKDELGEADGLRHKDKLIAKPFRIAELLQRIGELLSADVPD